MAKSYFLCFLRDLQLHQSSIEDISLAKSLLRHSSILLFDSDPAVSATPSLNSLILDSIGEAC